MPASISVASDRANIDLIFTVADGEIVDTSDVCIRFQFRAMMNGGYVIMGRLKDADFNIIKKLFVESQYFLEGRSNIFSCQFRIKWRTSDNQTKMQLAYVISMHTVGQDPDSADIEFVAIDPPSWYLNAGNASAKVYRGKVSDVIAACIDEYAPGIDLDISQTTDSSSNRFWMMRMDPKTFIASLLDWSCSLTQNKTQWLISMDGTSLQIREQAEIPSNNVALYTGAHCGLSTPNIKEWEVLANSALSIVNTELITMGMSAISGQYFDSVAGDDVVVKDSNTDQKYKARTTNARAFTKSPDGSTPPTVGYTAVSAVPEVYSAGEIGNLYSDYIDGRARSLFLNMSNLIMRARFKVIGHGIYGSSIGLGTDTITIQWFDVDGQPFFLHGNWIIYGFEHLYTPGRWWTDVYAARLDWNSDAQAVPAI